MKIRTTQEFDKIKSEVLCAIREFLGEKAEDAQVEQLYSLLSQEINIRCYGDASLTTEPNSLCLYQCGDKEYYHDGSEEPYKEITLNIITEEEYNAAIADCCEQTPSFHWYSDKLLSTAQEYFFQSHPKHFSEYYLYARGLFGIPFVRFEILRGI